MGELARANVRSHRAGFAGVFVAVLFAAMLVSALGVLVETGIRGGAEPQRYAGADVVVAAPQAVPVPEDVDLPLAEQARLPRDIIEEIADVPGVESATADVSVAATLTSAATAPQVAAHGWGSARLTPYGLADGREPEAPDELALDATLAERHGVGVGDEVELAVGAVPTTFTVTGLAETETDASGAGQAHAFLTDARARELAGHDAVDAVGVVAGDGVAPDDVAEQIEARVSGAEVRAHTGDRRGQVEFLDAGRARSELVMLSSSLAGTAVLIAVFVVSSTLGLSVHQRRREFALLRAIAATPRQIHRMIGAEIRLVAGTAALIGAVPGLGVAVLLRDAFVAGGLLPAGFGLAFSPLPVVAGFVLAFGSARVAGWFAARKPARRSPVEALGEASVEPRELPRGRIVAGWVLAGLGVATSALPVVLPGLVAVAGAAGSAMFLVIAVALLGPRLFAAAIAVAARPLGRLSRVSGYLAAANSRANARRLAAAVTPLVLAIAIVSVQVFSQTTISAAASRQAGAGVVADLVVDGASGLAPGVVAEIGATDGVAAATAVVRSEVEVRYDELGEPTLGSFAAQGITVDGLGSTLDLEPRDGDLGALGADTVALSQLAAESFAVGVGDRLAMTLGDGVEIEPTVVAVYGRGLGFGDVTLHHDVLAAHTTTGLTSSVLVAVEDGADVDTVTDSLTAATAGYSGLGVTDRDALGAAGDAERRTESLTNLVALAVLLLYIAVAVVNTLVMATAERGREFALLRLVGALPVQVRRMMRAEAFVVVGVAAVIGTLVAIPPLVGVSLGMTASPVPSINALGYLGIVGTTALLGLLAIGLPTRAALARGPVEAIGVRE